MRFWNLVCQHSESEHVSREIFLCNLRICSGVKSDFSISAFKINPWNIHALIPLQVSWALDYNQKTSGTIFPVRNNGWYMFHDKLNLYITGNCWTDTDKVIYLYIPIFPHIDICMSIFIHRYPVFNFFSFFYTDT